MQLCTLPKVPHAGTRRRDGRLRRHWACARKSARFGARHRVRVHLAAGEVHTARLQLQRLSSTHHRRALEPGIFNLLLLPRLLDIPYCLGTLGVTVTDTFVGSSQPFKSISILERREPGAINSAKSDVQQRSTALQQQSIKTWQIRLLSGKSANKSLVVEE